MSKPRKSGIDILGDLPWGSHLCLFYETRQDLLDALIPFFKAGLENNEFIIWVISDPHLASAEEAMSLLKEAVPDIRRHLGKGQIEILHEPGWYLREEEFNMEKIIKAWNDKLADSLARGYDGMRTSGDMFWLGQKYWKDFYAYEKFLHDFIAGLPAIILCTYPLPKFGGAEVLDIVQAHQFGIGKRQGKWELVESPELIRARGSIKTVTGELQEGKRQRPELRVIHYLAAFLSVVVTLILARTMAETLGVNMPVSLLLCSIMFSAWYGGVKPGLFALLLALIAFKFYLAGSALSWKIDAKELPRFVVFALSCLLVILLIGAQKKATGSLRRALAVLDSTIRKVRETNGALRLQIAERRQAEDQLRLAYQRLSYHVENTPLAILEFDKDLTITRWSGRAEEIFGWKESEALGKNVYDPDFRIIHEEDKKAVDKVNEELTKGTVNRNLSLNRNYTRNGEVIDCEWHNSVLRDEQGSVITIMSLVHDVTERKKTEQNLHRSYEEVRQLTRHLQNIREAERSHIAREIHDELGQQLTVLKMDVLGLSKKLGDSDTVIQQKIRDITDLLDTTVRSVRRISSELRPSLLYNLGLDAAIEWHLKEFGKRSGLKTIFIEPAGEVKIPDPVKNGLFRIFQESLTNVSRHANATKVIVSLEQKDGLLTLTIEDDGQGFEQERIGTKQTLGILGMRERCEMLGGNYAIQSAPGQGTTIAVAVPYDNENKSPYEIMQILIADDHAIVRKGIRQLVLEEYPSAIIEEIGDGNSLVAKACAGKWDVVICDLDLPGRSGLDAMLQIKEIAPKLPVLIMSIYPEEQYAKRLLKAGAAGYVSKDAATEELAKAVRMVLQGRKYVSHVVAALIAEDMGQGKADKTLHEALSNREFEIFKMIASGRSVSEIADTLSLSTTTVSTHRARILAKMCMRTNSELMRYALNNKLI